MLTWWKTSMSLERWMEKFLEDQLKHLQNSWCCQEMEGCRDLFFFLPKDWRCQAPSASRLTCNGEASNWGWVQKHNLRQSWVKITYSLGPSKFWQLTLFDSVHIFDKTHSNHPKTEPSGNWTVIFRTQFVSGFQMIH
jgi:hypothetical protein